MNPSRPQRPTCRLCDGTGKRERSSFKDSSKVGLDTCSNCKGKKRTPMMVDVYDVLELLHSLNTEASLAMMSVIEERFGAPNDELKFRSLEELDRAYFPNVENLGTPGRRLRRRE